jgi:hydrogenase maturation protease
MRCAGRVLILGYGNALRADDGFGRQAAERLVALVADPDIDIRAIHQLTPELAEPLSRAGRAIFIDAAREGAPGELRQQRIEPAPCGAFTHHLTPSALLVLARDLYGHAPPAVLFTAAGASFRYGQILSETMEAALGQVVSLLQEL